MATAKTLQDKLQAAISDILLGERRFSNTAKVKQAVELGASVTLNELERLCKDIQPGVRSIGFLDLPPELRNRIYEYIVPSPNGESIDIRSSYCAPHREEGQQPAITRVCRQLRHETLPMYYSMNHFTTYIGGLAKVQLQEAPVNKWLMTIGDDISKHIRHLTVVYHGSFRTGDDASQVEAIMSSKVLMPITQVVEVRKWIAAEGRLRKEIHRKHCTNDLLAGAIEAGPRNTDVLKRDEV